VKDNILYNYPVFFIACDICKHRTEGETCKAFPDGIPIAFIGGLPHEVIEESQQGDFVLELIELKEDASEELKDFYEIYKNIEAKNSRHEEKKKQEQISLEPIVIKE
jgi:hypothetical protein